MQETSSASAREGGLPKESHERSRPEDALRAAALAVSTAEGDALHRELMRCLATNLGVDAAFIAVFVDERRTHVQTLACWLDGRFLRNFQYPLEGSPCAAVVGRDFRFVPRGVLPEFQPGTIFRAQGIDSYAAIPLCDAAGAPLGLIAVMDREPMTDASLAESILKIFAARASAEIERRRAVDALADSEASYRAIFEASEDAIFVHDWDTGAILDVSPKAEALYGYPVDELRRMSVGAISAGDAGFTEDEARRRIAEAKAGRTMEFEWLAQHRDGRRRWHEVRLKRATIAGKPRILAFTRDITARRLAEDALRSSEEQYRAIFNASADALALWNSDLQRVDVNPAFERIYGFTREEMTSDGDPKDMPETEALRRREIVRRSLAGEACHLEMESLRKSGERFQAEVRTIPIRHRGEPHVLAVVRDITERKVAEAAVRASEEQYRAIFAATVDGLLLWDEEHRVVDVNDAFLAMHGYRREELIGQVEPFFIPGTLRDQCAVMLRRILEGVPCHLEARTRRKDGSEFDVEIRGIAMRYQGRPHALVTLRDVTGRREAGERLRASEKRYRLLFEMESDAILVTDAATLDLLDANRAAVELWGYDRDELLRMKATELSAEPEATRLALQGEAGTLAVPQRLHRKKDGTVFPVEITLNRFELDGRRIVLSAIRDATERRQREEALARSEAQYRAIFNASADALMLWNSRLQRVDVNPAHEKIFGFAREEVVGRGFEGLPYPDELVRPRIAMVRRALDGEPCRAELEALRKDGRRIFTELRTIPFLHRGEPHVLQIARDITERKRAEEERTKLEFQLRQAQKMEALGQLTGGIAHDFNNLLASIMGYIAMAGEHDTVAGDARLARYMDQAYRSCVRARDLIQQMLAFSRGRRSAPRPLALPSLVGESLALLRSSIPSHIDVRSSLSDDVPPVLLDPVQLEQVLMNLTINARDAMPDGGAISVVVEPTHAAGWTCASCRAAVDGDFVELRVADTGDGIPPGVLERMFEPFFTTKEVGRGTGMGLATVHGIVHEHGGHVVVESRSGSGTRFRVLFPGIRGEVAPAQMRSEKPSRNGFGPLAGRVLVVDDERAVGAYMQDLLSSWKLDVAVVDSPAKALEQLASGTDGLDVLITDQTMPGMSGLELARAAALLRPSLPVLIYSGHQDPIAGPARAIPQVRETLQKPIDPEALHAALRRALDEPSG